MDVGAHVSHYRLLRQLGEGGMGQVYLADDTLLGRHVALKFVRTGDPLDAVARRRLVHEAKAAASLDHPFICKIFEVGESGEGPFIAMEHLEGSTLEERLSGGKLPAADAVRIAGEIAEALDAAHRHGIVHRDLKPSNVMLTVDGHVKVMDFGIAKRFRCEPAAETESAPFTGDVAVGTLLYMSPEQVLGDPVTPASDLFALGLLLHEALTGTHPFKRSTALATATAIAHDVPDPLPPTGPETGPLDRVVQRLLAKHPGDRYPAARDVVEALGQLGRDRPRMRDAARIRIARWARPALLLSSVALIATLAAIGWFFRPGPALAFQERDWIVIADLDNRTADNGFDRAIESALAVALRQSRYVNVLPRARVAEAIRLTGRKEPAPMDEALASEVAVRENARAVLACSLAPSGTGYTLEARLVDPRTRQTVMAGAVRASSKQQVLSALDSLATHVRRRLGESLQVISEENTALPKATTSSLEALKLFVDGRQLAARGDAAGINLIREAVGLDPDFALAHADLAVAAYLGGDRATGEKHFERALALIDRLTLRERLWIQAVAQDSRGNREEAVVAYRTYLSRYPDDADGWYRLGWTQMATLDRPDDAVASFNNVLRINPASAGAYSNLATCYRLRGNLDRSLELYAKAFELRPDFLTGPFLNHEYGFALVAAGRRQEARQLFEKMASQTDSGKQAAGLRSMALLDMYEGRYRSAIGRLESAVLLNRASKNALGELRNHLFSATAARALGDRQRLAKELQVADRMIATQAFEPWIIAVAGAFHARDGQVRAARRVLDRMLASMGNRTALSAVNRSTRNDESAIDLLKGEIALAEGRWQEAVPLFEVSVRLNPDAGGAEALARAYVAGRRWTDAVRVYSSVAAETARGDELQDSGQLARYELGKLYERLGERAKARAAYEQLLQRWTAADPGLPALAQIKSRLQALGPTPGA